MTIEPAEGGWYLVHVDQSNLSVYVSWTISNDVIRTDDDIPYTFYKYPIENRLTQVTYPDGTITQYQYDLRNNMVSTTTITGTATETTAMTYDIENRLLQSGDKTFEYDNNGNQILGDTSYRYYSTFLDGYKVNWLISVGTIGGGGGGDEQQSAGGEPVTMSSTSPSEPQDETTPATSYGYALDGRRVGKAGAVEMKYLYDGENVIYELWDQMTVRFTQPIGKSSSCGSCGPCGNGGSASFTDHPISITILDEYGETAKYYYLYDGLGSVTELIDEGGNVVNVYRYDPFGGAKVKVETVYNPHQFTGRQYDAESGLYHYRARAYSPDVGRFLQQDPAGMVDGPNMYAYCGNEPVGRRDPSGMMAPVWFGYGGGAGTRSTMREPGELDLPWNEVEVNRREKMIEHCINSCAILTQCNRLPNKYSGEVTSCEGQKTKRIYAFKDPNLRWQSLMVHSNSYELCFSDCYYGSILRSLLRQVTYGRRPHTGPAWTHT